MMMEMKYCQTHKLFSFKSVTPFQTKFKAPVKKHNKSPHQQPLLLNDIDITSDDEEHICIPEFQNKTHLLLQTTLFMTKPKLTQI